MLQQSNRKRTRYYSDGPVQGALGSRIMVHWLIFIVLSATVQFVVRLVDCTTATPLTSSFLAMLSDAAIPTLVAFSLLPWFVRDSIRLSNRFAGPVYRLRMFLRKMVAGENAPPLAFRPGDFWPELAIEFNHLRQLFLQRTQSAQKSSEKVQALEAELKKITKAATRNTANDSSVALPGSTLNSAVCPTATADSANLSSISGGDFTSDNSATPAMPSFNLAVAASNVPTAI